MFYDEEDDAAVQLGFIPPPLVASSLVNAVPTANWGPSMVLESSRNDPIGTVPRTTMIYGSPLVQDIVSYNMVDTSRIPRTNYVEAKPTFDARFQNLVEGAIKRGATVFDSQSRPSSNKKILIFVAVGVVAAAVLFGMKKSKKRRK